jgi:HTH-type transcriptional regulator, competence development regulator
MDDNRLRAVHARRASDPLYHVLQTNAVLIVFLRYNNGIVKKLLEVDGMRLRELRREHALSQQDLERITGVAQSTLSALESGKRDAQPRTVRKLAEALGVEPRELMRRSSYA